jgi:hypothetical protein
MSSPTSTGALPEGAKSSRQQAGPKYLRWAFIEAAQHACRHEIYRDRYQRNERCLGRQRGAKVAQSTSPAA